ncbi:GNAT family N-acetyltransferase [Clostridium intestinale]|uniref:Acetyltransferase (GNAT) domain-containing protein n=1 Tax=Clostridium intestinale DSM 6191 TaxID=1121320 RepID=A0A1M5W2X3_9CLOT|nr:GNAT family N-acetyltransferase [Clostridium intestinale]SHH81862.1 Acetyltransferase (GNAT) domain-containing protein [Clostridium intestinale DSM 6191]
MLIIEHLVDHEECLDTVIDWLWKEFGNEDNYAFWESIVKNSLKKNLLPLTFIALMDNKPVGTVGLWRSDLLSRQDLCPWLSALFVKEEYRSKNIGQELQLFLIDYCRKKGYEEIFLYTDSNNYYEKTGWQYLDDGIEYSGGSIKIYNKKLR